VLSPLAHVVNEWL